MKLFDFKGNRVELDRAVSEIRPFRNIIEERDDSDTVLIYIYFMHDWQSSYQTLDEEERRKVLIEDLFDGDKSIIEDPLIKEAEVKYIELTETASMKVLSSARKAVRSLQKYFEEADVANAEDPGKAAKDLMSNLKNVGAIIKSIKDWEDQIRQEKDQSTIRKGVELNPFNE